MTTVSQSQQSRKIETVEKREQTGSASGGVVVGKQHVGDVAGAPVSGARRRRRVRTAAVLGRASEPDKRDAGAPSDAAERTDDVVTGGGDVTARLTHVDHPRGAELRPRVSGVASPQTLHAASQQYIG